MPPELLWRAARLSRAPAPRQPGILNSCVARRFDFAEELLKSSRLNLRHERLFVGGWQKVETLSAFEDRDIGMRRVGRRSASVTITKVSRC